MSLMFHCVSCAVLLALSSALHQDLIVTGAAPAAVFDRSSPRPWFESARKPAGLRRTLTATTLDRNDIPEAQEGDEGALSSHQTEHDLMDNITCPPLESLDFLHYNKNNKTEVQELENQWPCELREYWRSSNIQGLVSVVRFLFNYATIVVIVIGLLVNIYSLFVLNSPPINKTNMSVYLKALALSDIGVLLFNVTVGVLRAKSIQISNIYTNHVWMCVLQKILLSVFFDYSTWLVVTFTFERLLMIRNPFKIHTWNNEKPAKFAVVILAIVSLSLSLIRSITTHGFEKDNTYGYIPCEAHNHIKRYINLVPFIFITSNVPFILITTGNLCLLIHVRRSAQVQINLKATDDHAHTLKVTRMLIIISIVYVILFLPLGITGCIELLYRKNQPPRENHALYISWAKKIILLRWLRGLFFFVYLLNYVNNFFLYCLSGEIFRQAVKRCLPSYGQKICPCFTSESSVSTHISQRRTTLVPLTSQDTHRSTLSSQRKIFVTNTFPEAGYHNATFTSSEEETHL